jgi:hypothetical protein
MNHEAIWEPLPNWKPPLMRYPPSTRSALPFGAMLDAATKLPSPLKIASTAFGPQ